MRKLCLFLIVSLALGADEKAAQRERARELLDSAAKMVASAQPQVQVAALLHLGENYNLVDHKKSIGFLEQAFQSAADLPSSNQSDMRGPLQAEAVSIMAEVSLDKALEMLPQLSLPPGQAHLDPRLRPVEKVVQLLLEKKDFSRAIEVVAGLGPTGDYPFRAAQLIFEKLPADDPQRVEVFSAATTAYATRPNGPFPDLVSRHWQEVPRPIAEAALKALLNGILDRKDDSVMKSNISTAKGAVSFGSRQNRELFEILHVVRALDPKRADELIESRAELKSAVERFPLGMRSMVSEESSDVSMSVMQGSKGGVEPRDEAREQLNAIARSRVAEAMSVLRQDPQKALSLVRGIPVPAMRAEVLGSVARSVSEKDPSTAKSVLDQTIQILDDIQNPAERVHVWDIVAEAAFRAKEPERAWQAVDRGLADAAALYKKDADAEAPNEAPREYWPSTQSYRRIISRATRLFGTEAEPLLVKITDPDLALLARIEMAQALLGRPYVPGPTNVSRSGKLQMNQER